MDLGLIQYTGEDFKHVPSICFLDTVFFNTFKNNEPLAVWNAPTEHRILTYQTYQLTMVLSFRKENVYETRVANGLIWQCWPSWPNCVLFKWVATTVAKRSFLFCASSMATEVYRPSCQPRVPSDLYLP